MSLMAGNYKKVLIINGHPDQNQDHFCHALARSYQAECEILGAEMRNVHVAQLDFPGLRNNEEFLNGKTPDAIQNVQEDILWARHLVFVLPLWLGTIPACLKSFLEQTLRPGFAFAYTDNGMPKKLLAGRSVRIVVTMGMPAFVYRVWFRAHGIKNLKSNILKFCGFSPIWITMFGGVESVGDHERRSWLASMKDIAQKDVRRISR